jgi:ornithine cyclodeaminase/alanine dehydrogenase-like protein (mu-crystallin family)
MLLIDNEVVTKILSAADCVKVQEEAFADLQTGRAIHRPRIDLYAPCSREDGYYRWSSVEGVTVRPGPYLAMRVKSDIAYWPRTADGRWTEKKYCVEPGLYCGLVLVFSTETGAPLALINDGNLQHMRVGGAAGLGAKYLSRADSKVVGMLGSGGMAKAYLEAFKAVRSVERVRVFSPNPAHRAAFAKAMTRELQIEVEPADCAEMAVADSDIVATCTDSMEPTIRAEWLRPGMHVTNVGPYEIDHECLARFDLKIRQGEAGGGSDSLPDSNRLKREVGQSPLAYVAGTEAQMQRLPPKPSGRVGFGGKFPHIAELITGVHPGRTSATQISFYHNFGNQGLQFACIGGLVYERARDQGLGRNLPDEWFLQDVRN